MQNLIQHNIIIITCIWKNIQFTYSVYVHTVCKHTHSVYKYTVYIDTNSVYIHTVLPLNNDSIIPILNNTIINFNKACNSMHDMKIIIYINRIIRQFNKAWNRVKYLNT